MTEILTISSKSSDTSIIFFCDNIISIETNNNEINEWGNRIFINRSILVFSTFWLRYLNSWDKALSECRKTKYNVKLMIIGNRKNVKWIRNIWKISLLISYLEICL